MHMANESFEKSKTEKKPSSVLQRTSVDFCNPVCPNAHGTACILTLCVDELPSGQRLEAAVVDYNVEA